MDEKLAVMKSRFKRVCVFCGSSTGNRNSYREAALELGQELNSRKLDLVYGGGSAGLMGLIAHEVHRGGGHVLGIIPKTLMRKEITGETVGEVRPVANMHQRKAEMARHSDCFIALPGPSGYHVVSDIVPITPHHWLPSPQSMARNLNKRFFPERVPAWHFPHQYIFALLRFAPGGYGTLEELLEVITWAQLGIHDKPVGLLNVDGYYNYLLTFIDKAVDDGFITPSQRHIIVSAPNAALLFQKLEEYVPVHDGVVAKARWEVEQVELNASLQSEVIAR